MKSYLKLFLPIGLVAIITLFTCQISYAHWTTKGPYGGSVKTLLTLDTTIFVGTFDGGVYRSTSSQILSWRYANYTGLSSPHINALAAIGNTVFAGTADAGIFATSNLGNSWSAMNNGLNNLHILALASGSGQTLYAGTDGGGVFISTNGGSSWQSSNSGLSNLIINAIAVSGSLVFIGTEGGGVFVSLDGGTSWTAANTGLTELNVNALAITGTTLVAGTDAGVFSASAVSLSWGNNALSSYKINSLLVSGNTIYAATSGGVFTASISGFLWMAATDGYDKAVNAVAVLNNKVVGGTQNDGLIKSNSLSSITWSKVNTGFNNLKTYALYNDGLLVIVATNKGMYVSRDLAASYIPSNSGLTDSLHVTSLTFAGANLYISTQFGGVFMSPDTGKTWTAVNTGLTNLSLRHIIATNTRLVVAAANGEVYNTLISPINWAASSGLPSGLDISALAATGSSVFLGTKSSGIFHSSDGSSWADFSSGLGSQSVTSLAILGDNIYAGTDGGGVFRTSWNSAAWNAVNNGLPTLHILSLAAAGQHLVAGYKGGVYTSYDDGASWLPPNVLLYIPEYADVHKISFSTASTRIFIATPDNSSYSNNITELPTAVWDIEKEGGSLNLYPNPNHGQFQVEIKNIAVKLRDVLIYDQTGRLIDSFISPNGEQSLSVSVHCPPGMYTLCVVTEKGLVAQKLLIE